VSCNCNKAKNIVKGHLYNTFKSIKPEVSEAVINERFQICQACEYKTALDMLDYLKHIRAKQLPVKKDGVINFCALCKCSLNAKIRVLNEKCRKGKW
jgi:hypothetical protein